MNKQDIKDALQVLWGDMEDAIAKHPSDNLYEIRADICHPFHEKYTDGIRRRIVRAYVWSGLWGDNVEPIELDAYTEKDWVEMWYQGIYDTYELIGNEWTWEIVDGAIDDGCYDEDAYWNDVYGLNTEVK